MFSEAESGLKISSGPEPKPKFNTEPEPHPNGTGMPPYPNNESANLNLPETYQQLDNPEAGHREDIQREFEQEQRLSIPNMI